MSRTMSRAGLETCPPQFSHGPLRSDGSGPNAPTGQPGKPCEVCKDTPELMFSMAFQPIVNVCLGSVTAYEALARGPAGEPASYVLNDRLDDDLYAMDQRCREKAIGMAAQLGLLESPSSLFVNFYPNSVYQPREFLQRTLAAAARVNLPPTRLVFEITESEEIRDHDLLEEIMQEYRSHGLRAAIDDFGAGHSGLNLLSSFQPDFLKVDRKLVDRIDDRPASRAIVRSITHVCRDLGIETIAEGVEREEEMCVLSELGIQLMQGFFFARPLFEGLPTWPPTSSPHGLEPFRSPDSLRR